MEEDIKVEIMNESAASDTDVLEYDDYDSEYDASKFNITSDTDNESDESYSEVFAKKKRKINRRNVALGAGPSTDSDVDDPPAGLSSQGKRKHSFDQRKDDLIVKFDMDTIQSTSGFVWNTEPSTSLSACTPLNITSVGPTPEASQADTPEKCFSLLFSDEMINEVVNWTNQKIDIERSKYKKQSNTVQRTTAKEIRALLGVLIFSGYRRDNHLSSRDVWSSRMGAPFYRTAMSEGRFNFLLTCLQFDDYTTREDRETNDSFASVRKVWDIFIANCSAYYNPHEFLTVGEQLLAFRGKCPFRMYIPSNAARYGIKLFLANDVRSNYMLAGIPYLGKPKSQPKGTQNLAHIITKELTQQYHMTGRNVTADNRFTSVPLLEDLVHNCGLTMIGVVRESKKEIPQIMRETSIRSQGSSAFLFTTDMTLVSYMPKPPTSKNVLLMSSMHGDISLSSSGKPTIIEDYNRTKGAVETFNRMCNQYSCSRKTIRWSLCFFYGMVNAGVVNSWIIHSENLERVGDTRLPRKKFMEELALSLAKPWATERLTAASNISRELKETICSVYEFPTPSKLSGTVPSAAESREPLVRCLECPSRADKKTRFRCVSCLLPICPKHYYCVCANCLSV